MDLVEVVSLILSIVGVAGVVYCFIELKAVGAGLLTLSVGVNKLSAELHILAGGK